MSLVVIENEIRRFLSDATPSVLCIKGGWGVGKTHCWRKVLDEARKSDAIALNKYSYVSLFGLSSLDNLRYMLFENTVIGRNIGKNPDEKTFGELIRDSNVARKLKSVADLMGAFFNRQGVVDVIARSAFFAVREHLICLDDLERAGSGLGAREVLGLVSQLKEERKCKIVLLLNDEKHNDKVEFERQIEKVADTILGFELTPEEASAIALDRGGRATCFIHPRLVELGITNIRVIKKIESLANRLIDILPTTDAAIVSDAVATLVLASWAVQQPCSAPSLDFLRSYSNISFSVRASNGGLDPEVARYREILVKYNFYGANDLDHIIINGVQAGHFSENAIRDAADLVIKEFKKNSRDNDFYRAWDELYHGSLAVDDDEFLDALWRSAIKDAAVITPLNINSAIRILRDAGRENQADEVIAAYIAARTEERIEFFDISNHHFSADDQVDEGLCKAFSERRAAYVDRRAPLDALRDIAAKGRWDNLDVVLMGKQSADDFERLFESLTGDEVRVSIKMVYEMGRGHYADSKKIRAASLEALRRIAGKSPLRARKIRGWGISLEPSPDDVH